MGDTLDFRSDKLDAIKAPANTPDATAADAPTANFQLSIILLLNLVSKNSSNYVWTGKNLHRLFLDAK